MTERDRWTMDQLARRAASLGHRLSGPTSIYRAGMLALMQLSDDEFARTVDAADDRPSVQNLGERFESWCAHVASSVWNLGGRELEWSYEGNRHRERMGHFHHQLRLAHVAMVPDGRVLLSGTEVNAGPLTPGAPIPQMRVMFPGGLAALVSMDEEGGALAAEAITAWLLNDDERLDKTRNAIAHHAAQPLR